MNKKRQIYIVALSALFSSILPAQQPPARAIMERVKEQDRTKDTTAELKMTLLNARGSNRERQLTQVTKTGADDNRKQLIRFQSPADVAGTGFLSIEHSDRDDDRWLYLPALRKTRRIAGSDKTDSFVGSEFTYEDLESEELNDYAYKLRGEENVNGIETWIIEAVASEPERLKESGYGKRELWINKTHHLIVQAKFYDKQGAYTKRLLSENIRQVTGSQKWRPYKLTMEDVRKGKKTVLEIAEYQIDQGAPDDYFSQRYLKRGK